jgi:hypothetical protein
MSNEGSVECKEILILHLLHFGALIYVSEEEEVYSKIM